MEELQGVAGSLRAMTTDGLSPEGTWNGHPPVALTNRELVDMWLACLDELSASLATKDAARLATYNDLRLATIEPEMERRGLA